MYQWVVFLHVVGAFGFVLAHGTSMFVSLKLRRERDLERVRALLDISGVSLIVMYALLLLMLVAGITAGFMGHWWGRGWIWAALALLVVMAIVMSWLGTEYYDRVRKAVGLPGIHSGRKNMPPELASAEELDKLLSSPHPFILTAVGAGGLLVILRLMMLKPF